MRVLVCGSRKWTDRAIVFRVLDGFGPTAADDTTIIEGQCPYGGADAFAAEWAQIYDDAVEHLPFPPEIRNGVVQGPARNQRMLDEGKPDVVIAFKDGFQRDVPGWEPGTDGKANFARPIPGFAKGGTEDMVRRAKAAGIPVYIVSHG